VKTCPKCGGKVEKLISASSVQFKGSGWYVSDYGRKGAGGGDSKNEGGEGKKEAGEGKKEGGEGKKEGGESKPAEAGKGSDKKESKASKSEKS